MHEHRQAGGHREATRVSAWLAFWTLAWVGSLALARLGPIHLWDSEAMSWAAIGANLAVGLGWIVAHARYLRGIDELQRKINLDALAVTLGVGFVAGFAYVAVDQADLIDRDINVALLPVLMAVVYMATIAVGTLRYR